MSRDQISYSFSCLTTGTEKRVHENSYTVNVAALKHGIGDHREQKGTEVKYAVTNTRTSARMAANRHQQP